MLKIVMLLALNFFCNASQNLISFQLLVVYCSYTTNMLVENLYGEKPTESQTGECHFSRHKFFLFEKS